MNPTPSKKRFVVLLVFMTLLVFGFSYLRYRDMVKPIPEFNSLKQIPADGLRYEIARPRDEGTQVSIEFFDPNGIRYQTDYMEGAEAIVIDDALQHGGVMLFVGPWNHAFESKSIFSVYHMTRGDKVLIDYKRMAESKKLDQERAVPFTVLATVLCFGIGFGTLAVVFWIQYKRAADADAKVS